LRYRGTEESEKMGGREGRRRKEREGAEMRERERENAHPQYLRRCCAPGVC